MSALPIIGGVLGGLGSIFGASGANSAAKAQIQAGKDAMNQYDQRTAEGMARQALAMYGPQAEQYLRSALPKETVDKLFGVPAANPAFSNQQRERLNAIDQEIQQLSGIRSTQDISKRQQYGDRLAQLQSEREGLVRDAGGSAGSSGSLDLASFNEYAKNNPGFLSQMKTIAGEEEQKGQGLLGEFNADTERLSMQGDQNAREIGKYGEQERKRIALASDRALAGLNRQTQSRLLSSGLGNSTLLTQQMSGNTRNVREAEDNAMGSVSDRQLSMLSGIRQGNLSAAYGRAGQKTGLQSGLLDRNLNLRTAPLTTELQMTTGAGFNPWLGRDTTQYYPGVSPGGSALSTIGNSISGVGGLMLGNWSQGGGGSRNNSQTSGGQQRFNPYTGMPEPM